MTANDSGSPAIDTRVGFGTAAPTANTRALITVGENGTVKGGTVLVNPKGRPWNLDTLTKEISRIAKLAGIFHVGVDQAGQSGRRHKHLHDTRGTFATYLMTTTDLTDAEIASIMGWSEAEVERIRRIYVDDTARQIALGKRIARGLIAD